MQLETIKGWYVDILIIGLALIFANNINKAQSKQVLILKEQKEIELKKQLVLNDINKLYTKISAVKGYINKKDISTAVNSLTDIAKVCYIQIESLRPRGEDTHPEYVVYPFDLSVLTDDFHKMGKFISRLESSPDLYTIRSFDFHPINDSGTGKNKLAANLLVSTV